MSVGGRRGPLTALRRGECPWGGQRRRLTARWRGTDGYTEFWTHPDPLIDFDFVAVLAVVAVAAVAPAYK